MFGSSNAASRATRVSLPVNARSYTGTIDNRIIGLMRLILASSGLLIILIDSSEPDRLVAVTYAALTLYTIYSVVLYVLVLRSASFVAMIGRWAHWADVGWYTLLIALSSGTNSIFFFGFFFAILVASFRWGFTSGLRVVGASVILFTTIGLATAPAGENFELNRSLLRPIYLFVLGYMIAYWGGFEITLKRRLGLLKEVTTLSNPRFGVDRTIGWLVEQLRAFYDADSCLLVTADPSTGEHRLRRADRDDSERAMRPEPMPGDLAQRLLALPDDLAIVYNGTRHGWRGRPRYHAYHATTGERTAEGQEMSEALAAGFDAESFITVPLRYRNEGTSRLYLTAAHRHAFDDSDADFLLQVIDHFAPVVENIQLVDRLASDAAEAERQRIARDLHDSVIQPYIGLQLGLTAIQQKVATGDTNVAGDIDRLLGRIGNELADLRGYLRGLKSTGEHTSTLLPSLRRFVAKFTEATGIAVRVEAADDLRLNDRLAAEVFQMVAEGLSNVRRHTYATGAAIVLARRGGNLLLRIEDEGTAEAPQAPFSPRSISERAAALGGQAYVERGAGGGSAVVVEIPL